jgi:NADPH:quinone reductase-like Zn-dependent oxidoreductase
VLNSGDGGGRWLGPFGRVIASKLLGIFISQRVGTFEAKANSEDLETLRAMIEAGQVKPVIERTYSLSETPEAIRQVEKGHVRGKLAIAVNDSGERGGDPETEPGGAVRA